MTLLQLLPGNGYSHYVPLLLNHLYILLHVSCCGCHVGGVGGPEGLVGGGEGWRGRDRRGHQVNRGGIAHGIHWKGKGNVRWYLLKLYFVKTVVFKYIAFSSFL